MTPQEFFKKDRFADNVGVELIEIKEGYGKARLVITEEHLNAGNRTQGGALFTLADLALAAAANSHGTLAFSLSSNITFLRSSGPGTRCMPKPANGMSDAAPDITRLTSPTKKGELVATFESSVFRKGGCTAVCRSPLGRPGLLFHYGCHRIAVSPHALEKGFRRAKVQIHIQTYGEVVLVIGNKRK